MRNQTSPGSFESEWANSRPAGKVAGSDMTNDCSGSISFADRQTNVTLMEELYDNGATLVFLECCLRELSSAIDLARMHVLACHGCGTNGPSLSDLHGPVRFQLPDRRVS